MYFRQQPRHLFHQRAAPVLGGRGNPVGAQVVEIVQVVAPQGRVVPVRGGLQGMGLVEKAEAVETEEALRPAHRGRKAPRLPAHRRGRGKIRPRPRQLFPQPPVDLHRLQISQGVPIVVDKTQDLLSTSAGFAKTGKKLSTNHDLQFQRITDQQTAIDQGGFGEQGGHLKIIRGFFDNFVRKRSIIDIGA